LIVMYKKVHRLHNIATNWIILTEINWQNESSFCPSMSRWHWDEIAFAKLNIITLYRILKGREIQNKSCRENKWRNTKNTDRTWQQAWGVDDWNCFKSTVRGTENLVCHKVGSLLQMYIHDISTCIICFIVSALQT
jgi:hypothetical protein